MDQPTSLAQASYQHITESQCPSASIELSSQLDIPSGEAGMSLEKQVAAALPSDVAQGLIATGNARQVPTTRTGLPIAEIVVTGMGVLTTIVTLDQATAALDDLAHRLIAWRRRTHLDREPVISVDAEGPNGRISLQLTASTTDQELAEVIAIVLRKPSKAESDRTPHSPKHG
jgi:hypothetical protein